MSAHPDRGGSHDQMARVNKAYEHLQNRGSNIPKSKALAPTKNNKGKAALGLAAAGGLGYVGQKLLSDKEASMWSWER